MATSTLATLGFVAFNVNATKLNVAEKGYFRVNYDTNGWKCLAEQLAANSSVTLRCYSFCETEHDGNFLEFYAWWPFAINR